MRKLLYLVRLILFGIATMVFLSSVVIFIGAIAVWDLFGLLDVIISDSRNHIPARLFLMFFFFSGLSFGFHRDWVKGVQP